MGDMIKASGHLDLDNKPFHSGFGSPMGKLNSSTKILLLQIKLFQSTFESRFKKVPRIIINTMLETDYLLHLNQAKEKFIYVKFRFNSTRFSNNSKIRNCFSV